MPGRRILFLKTVVYRSEYLAYQVLAWLEQGAKIGISDFQGLDEKEKLKTVQEFMAHFMLNRIQKAFTIRTPPKFLMH